VLYNQFKYFFNMFFLVVALSQFVPQLQVGLMVTYVGPLVFVLAVNMIKEMYDDCQRASRDREMNNAKYAKITSAGVTEIASSDIKVGHII